MRPKVLGPNHTCMIMDAHFCHILGRNDDPVTPGFQWLFSLDRLMNSVVKNTTISTNHLNDNYKIWNYVQLRNA